jgi:anti-sigma B factor antagonist
MDTHGISPLTTILPGIELTETCAGNVIIVSVSGCVDMRTAADLTAAIDRARAKAPSGGVIVDLTDVKFLGAAGINSLLAGHLSRAAYGFGVVADGPVTSRPITVLGLHAEMALFPTLNDALVGVAAA